MSQNQEVTNATQTMLSQTRRVIRLVQGSHRRGLPPAYTECTQEPEYTKRRHSPTVNIQWDPPTPARPAS